MPVIPPHCGDPDHLDPLNCPGDRLLNRPPFKNTTAVAIPDDDAVQVNAVIPTHCGDPDHLDPIDCPGDRWPNRPPFNNATATTIPDDDAVVTEVSSPSPPELEDAKVVRFPPFCLDLDPSLCPWDGWDKFPHFCEEPYNRHLPVCAHNPKHLPPVLDSAAAGAAPVFKKATIAGNFTSNANFTTNGVAALDRTSTANGTTAPENPYQRNQFEYDARSMGFAIGIMILVCAFFAWVLLADICSGKYRLKKRFWTRPRAALAAKFQGEGLPFWNKNQGPQQQLATPGQQQQQMSQRSESAAGTAATGASGNTTTFVATSTTVTPEPPAKASSETTGHANRSDTTNTSTGTSTRPNNGNGNPSNSAPAATTVPARSSNGRSASAVSATSPANLSLKTSNPPRIPTPAAISALDDGKRQSNNSLGRAVLSVFSK